MFKGQGQSVVFELPLYVYLVVSVSYTVTAYVLMFQYESECKTYLLSLI